MTTEGTSGRMMTTIIEDPFQFYDLVFFFEDRCWIFDTIKGGIVVIRFIPPMYFCK